MTTGSVSAQAVAAVDLGSNSFHMVLARPMAHELSIVDRVREPVRLAAGLGSKGWLSDEAQERALACLGRMGDRLRDVPGAKVRAVGTSTLRKAKNALQFVKKAQKALGHPIEVVSGMEEARLIYLGVAHSLSDDMGRRLVVDIGGGSTEAILGERFEALSADSMHMGCVGFTKRFFPKGNIDREAMRKAETAARLELRPIERRFKSLGWDTCAGASGTIGSIAEVLHLNGWSSGGITRDGLKKLRKAVLAAGNVGALDLPGLKPERRDVLPGGLAILVALFEGLEVDLMTHALGALREGLLYDLVGRIRHEDVRDRTIRRFVERYHVDLEQSGRVERSALALLDQVKVSWDFGYPAARQMLQWAARLHEIGMVVSYSAYHKHGAYLVRNSYMPGFSNDGQRILATLIRAHRRKLSNPHDPDLHALEADWILRLVVILRLAVLFNRNRTTRVFPAVEASAKKAKLKLTFSEGWLDDHPLMRADLEEEAGLLGARGFKLGVS